MCVYVCIYILDKTWLLYTSFVILLILHYTPLLLDDLCLFFLSTQIFTIQKEK